jgi:hypothetical protein
MTAIQHEHLNSQDQKPLSALPALAASPPKLLKQSARHSQQDVEARLGAAAVPLEMFCMLCAHNSDALLMDQQPSTLKYYHSITEPPMKVNTYIDRIARYCDCGAEGVLIALRLAGRLHRVAGTTLTRLSVHRILITALTVGVKAHMDVFRSNRVIADAGGLQLRELNGLEFAMFRELGYRVQVSQTDIQFMLHHAAAASAALHDGRIGDAVEHARAAFLDDADDRALMRVSLGSSTTGRVHSTSRPASDTSDHWEISRSPSTMLAMVDNASIYHAPLETSVDLSP